MLSPEADVAPESNSKLAGWCGADLPEEFRLVLMLRDVDGLSVEETAEVLQILPQTVKTRLLRARRRLQATLEPSLQDALKGAFPFAGTDCEALTEHVWKMIVHAALLSCAQWSLMLPIFFSAMCMGGSPKSSGAFTTSHLKAPPRSRDGHQRRSPKKQSRFSENDSSKEAEPRSGSASVLFVADLLHPVHDFAEQCLLDRDVCHCGRGCGSMPMLLARRKPDHVARPDFLNRTAPMLCQPNAPRDDQCLTEWMRMPCGAGARLKRDAGSANTCRFGCLEQRVDANRPGEIISRSLARRLRTASFDLH